PCARRRTTSVPSPWTCARWPSPASSATARRSGPSKAASSGRSRSIGQVLRRRRADLLRRQRKQRPANEREVLLFFGESPLELRLRASVAHLRRDPRQQLPACVVRELRREQ